jgi:hypothetical protein
MATTLLSEPDTRIDLLNAVDALTVGTRTKVIHHSSDGDVHCTSECVEGQHTHISTAVQAPLLTQLNDAIRETMSARPGGGASLAHTRGMLDSDALYLFSRIASTISDWAYQLDVPHRATPVEMLRAWYVKRNESEHDDASDRFLTKVLRGWEGQINATLDPSEEQTLEEPCPNPDCPQGVDEHTGRPIWWNRQTRTSQTNPLIVSYRKDEPAKLVDNARARCRACGTEWSARALAWELERAAVPEQQDGA